MPRKKPSHWQLDSEIALRLKWTRRALGVTQTRLAARLGVNRTTYTEYERGTFRIPVHHALTLARIAAVNLDWIYAGQMAYLSAELQERLQTQIDRDPTGELPD